MNYIGNLLKLYSGTGWLLLLYFFSLVLLWGLEKEKDKKTVFLFTAVPILLIVLNPLVGLILNAAHILPERMVRLYWLLPVGICIAYAFVLIVRYVAGKHKQIPVLFVPFLLIVALLLLGSPVQSRETFTKSENLYKLPQEVLDLTDAVNADALALSGGDEERTERLTVFPPSLCAYPRLYDPSLPLLYGRYPQTDAGVDVFDNFNREEINLSRIMETSTNAGVDYLILDATRTYGQDRAELLGEPLATIGDYCLYRLN
ncbi:MAG: hypothetical protein K6G07_01040 [Lachnospiraceae bacterium]|nr:hypothetical protein [Lachnospiraceae bacterium]